MPLWMFHVSTVLRPSDFPGGARTFVNEPNASIASAPEVETAAIIVDVCGKSVRHIACPTAPAHAAYPEHLAALFPSRQLAAARAEIAAWEGYAPTPCWSLSGLADELGIERLRFKDESFRFGLASFKALGGAYAVLRVLQRVVAQRAGEAPRLADLREGRWARLVEDVTVATATDGNHGRSVAWGAQRFGCRCKVFMHQHVSEGRADAVRAFGAEVVRVAGRYDDSVRACAKEAEQNGWHVVADTAYDGYTEIPTDVMAGYAVITAEVVGQTPPEEPPTHLFVQGGVGGLAAALAAHLWIDLGPRRPQVVVVEPDRADALFRSARRGQPVAVEIQEETIMAGLSCGEVSTVAWPILAEAAGHYLTIPDDVIPPAMRLLADAPHGDPPIVSGESGVAGLAALLHVASDERLRREIGLDASSRVLAIGTEGATDPEIYRQLTGRAPTDVRP